MTSSTDIVTLPEATTAERDANYTGLLSPSIFFNTTTQNIELTKDGGATWDTIIDSSQISPPNQSRQETYDSGADAKVSLSAGRPIEFEAFTGTSMDMSYKTDVNSNSSVIQKNTATGKNAGSFDAEYSNTKTTIGSNLFADHDGIYTISVAESGTDTEYLKINGETQEIESLRPHSTYRPEVLVTSSRDIQASDVGKTLVNITGLPYDLTLPLNATFPNKIEFEVLRAGLGALSVTADPGVTLNGSTQTLVLENTYDRAIVMRTGTNSYSMSFMPATGSVVPDQSRQEVYDSGSDAKISLSTGRNIEFEGATGESVDITYRTDISTQFTVLQENITIGRDETFVDVPYSNIKTTIGSNFFDDYGGIYTISVADQGDEKKYLECNGFLGQIESFTPHATFRPKRAIVSNRDINASDVGRLLVNETASNHALTLPLNATFANTAEFEVMRSNTGALSVQCAVGVTLNGFTQALALSEKYDRAIISRVGQNEYTMSFMRVSSGMTPSRQQTYDAGANALIQLTSGRSLGYTAATGEAFTYFNRTDLNTINDEIYNFKIEAENSVNNVVTYVENTAKITRDTAITHCGAYEIRVASFGTNEVFMNFDGFANEISVEKPMSYHRKQQVLNDSAPIIRDVVNENLGRLLVHIGTSNIVLEIPAGLSSTSTTSFELTKTNTGGLTILAAPGVTLNGTTGQDFFIETYERAIVTRQPTADNWIISYYRPTGTAAPQTALSAFGGMYFKNNSLITTISAANTPVKVNANYNTITETENLSHASGTITMGAIDTSCYNVECHIAARAGSTVRNNYTFYIRKNGVNSSESLITVSLDNQDTHVRFPTCQAFLELSENDTLELWVENNDGTQDVEVDSIYFTVVDIARN